MDSMFQRAVGTTLMKHIMEEQRKHPHATGHFSELLSQFVTACKIINREVNKAGLVDILGSTNHTNVQGEVVKKLDEFSNSVLINVLDHTGFLAGMASEENADIIKIPKKFPKGNYVLVFDPLDGSSNIDVNVSIGTIFGVFKKISSNEDATEEDFLRTGRDLVAAGYVVYGSSTIMVITTGQGVFGFTLDPSVGEFILSHPNIRIPESGSLYSVNEGNYNKWAEDIRNYVDHIKQIDSATKRPYKTRYIGSLVADFHRNLLTGGIFLYPRDKNTGKGKLRLLYEAAPLAFVVEQAGGLATDGVNNILDIKPQGLHDRVPLFIGSKNEVLKLMDFLKE